MGLPRRGETEACLPASSFSSDDKDCVNVAAKNAVAANDGDLNTTADLEIAAASTRIFEGTIAMPNAVMPASVEDQERAAEASEPKSFVRRALSGRTSELLRSLELTETHPSSIRGSLSNALDRSNSGVMRAASDSNPPPRRRISVNKIDRSDVETGELLGSGGFNHVYNVKNVRRASVLGLSDSDSDSTDNVSSSEWSEAGNYVVKRLGPQVMDDEGRFRAAAIDLAHEAKLLSSINHPHVVKLHGVTRGCIVSAFSSENDAGYFLLLDKLDCTLDQRIREWREEEDVIKGTWSGGRGGSLLHSRLFSSRTRSLLFAGHNSVKKVERLRHASLLRRLDVGRQIATAISYLHSCNIIYRDLKPGNVGFDDATGLAKVFDFGLSRELSPGDADRCPTSMAGTPRYMAPEVMRCQRYGLSADVYSFGLLLWEMCALKRPYRKLTARELSDKVAYGTKRPKIRSHWPADVRDLMSRCWDPDPTVRPEFEDIVMLLEEVVIAGEGDDLIKNVSNHTV